MKKSLHLALCCLIFYSAHADNMHVKHDHKGVSILSPYSVTRAGSNIDVVYQRCTWRINPDSSAKGIKGSVLTKFVTTQNGVTSISFDMNAVLVVDSMRYRNNRVAAANIVR